MKDKMIALIAGAVLFASWCGLEGGAFSLVQAGLMSMLAAPVFVNSLKNLGAFND